MMTMMMGTLWLGPRRAAAACRPGVVLEGDADLLPPIAEALRRRGIDERRSASLRAIDERRSASLRAIDERRSASLRAIDERRAAAPRPGDAAGPECPKLRAGVRRSGAALLVNIHEEVRHAERHVADADTAATLIESFARSDIAAPLLAARPVPATRPVPAGVPPLRGPDEVAAAPVPPLTPPAHPGSSAPRFAAALALEGAGDTSRSGWVGAVLRGCAVVGPVCAGATLRFSGQPAHESVSVGSTTVDLSLLRLDALLSAEWPIRLRRVALLPGAGVGLGWLRYDAGPYGSLDSAGLRFEVRLGLLVPLRRGLGLELSLAGTAAALGSSTLFVPVPHEGESSELLKVMAPPPPWGYLGGGVGLRWEGPTG